jgi:hypothetical protein
MLCITRRYLNLEALARRFLHLRVPSEDSEPKESVTDDEMRFFLVRAKASVDELAIPTEGYEVDVAAEVGAMLDRAVGKQ